MRKRFERLCWMVIWFHAMGVATAQQTPDTTYRHPLQHQAYAAGKGPMIFIDQAHHNFHTLEGGFMAFSRLMEQDGYRVGASTTALDQPGALADCKVLVIANPLHGSNDGNWTLPTPSAFTRAEIDSIRLWVQEGGSLLLIADHMPFAGAASDLAQIFGFQMLNGFAYTRQNTWPPSVFSRLNASLPDSIHRLPLTKINPDGTESTDSTFSVEQMKISSDDVLINGWLYLPLGKGPLRLRCLRSRQKRDRRIGGLFC